MSRLRRKTRYKESKIGRIIINHIMENKRGYLIITILFFIGLTIGVFFINYVDDNKMEEIYIYLNELINKVRMYNNINLFDLLKQSIISNFIIILLLWLGASTIIGIPIVYGTIVLKGFSIGYTISSIITCFGIKNGILISVSIMLLHNIIFIPAMLGAGVSGVRLYQSIRKNKNRDNIKLEILRHTLFCMLMMLLMLLASIIEIYCSTNLFIILLKKYNF